LQSWYCDWDACRIDAPDAIVASGFLFNYLTKGNYFKMTVVSPNYSIRFTTEEKADLRELARRLQRKQADTIRLLVRESLKALQKQDVVKQKPKTTKQSRSRPAN
jgi:predicted DNA-binding protein